MPWSLAEISDRMEIQDMYSRYAHAADDRDSLDDIFLPDTIFDWTSCGGGKMSYEEAKAGPVFTGKMFPWSFHLYSNVRIEFSDDRSAAVVKVKAINPSGLPNKEGEPMMFQNHGAYTDHLKKTTDGWKIVSRFWQEYFITGPFQKVNGFSQILEIAGHSTDAA